jgi:aspartate kinase
VSLIQNSAISFTVCVEDKYERFNELKSLLSKRFQISWHENVSLYTIRHFNEKAVTLVETDKSVLAKQILGDTIQIVTKE